MSSLYKLGVITIALFTGLTGCTFMNEFAPDKQESELVFSPAALADDQRMVDFCVISEPEVKEPIVIPEPKKPNLAAKLYFVTDTTTLIAESAFEAEDIYQKIVNIKAPEVIVIGHTDTMGNVDYNIDLSLRRAEAVKNSLIERGVDPDTIRASWHGENLLLIETPDETEEQQNRRVEIYVR